MIGLIVLIVGAVLFVAGPIIAVVWAVQSASSFADTFLAQERDKLINQVSIEPGRSVEAATTQVTDVSRPITVAIHIQRLGERGAAEGDGLGQQLQQQQQLQLQLPREQREARLIETVIDPSGTVVSNNSFSANLFTDFQPQNTGNHILNITNAGATNVTIFGIFGNLPFLSAAQSFEEGGQALPNVDLSTFSGVIVGGVLTAIGYITIIAGIIIVAIESRKGGRHKGGFSGVTEGGISYRKD